MRHQEASLQVKGNHQMCLRGAVFPGGQRPVTTSPVFMCQDFGAGTEPDA